MILHARPMRRLTTNVNLALVLMGLVVLPISAKGQVATSPVTPTDARVDTPPAPQVQAVLTGESAFAPPTVEAADLQPSISARLTAPVATSASATPLVDDQNSMEQRLQRLERMVESILGELKDRPTLEGQRMSRRVSAEPMTSAYARASRQAAPSLTELKKQRIDIEDQLDQLKVRLNDIDDQIAKLQSVRSRNGFDRDGAKK